MSDASGELEITEVGKYPLKVGLLDSKVSMFLSLILACYNILISIRMPLFLTPVPVEYLLG